MKHLGIPKGVACALGVSDAIVIPTFTFGGTLGCNMSKYLIFNIN
jgi:hypothetical protein